LNVQNEHFTRHSCAGTDDADEQTQKKQKMIIEYRQRISDSPEQACQWGISVFIIAAFV